MPYAIYNGKRVVSGDKYVIGAAPLIPVTTGWTNVSYDVFTSSGQNITSAIKAAGSTGYADTDLFYIEDGDKVYYRYAMVLNFGSYPTNTPQLYFSEQFFGQQATQNLSPLFNGIEFSFTCYLTGNYYLRFRTYNNNQTDVSCDFTIYKK